MIKFLKKWFAKKPEYTCDRHGHIGLCALVADEHKQLIDLLIFIRETDWEVWMHMAQTAKSMDIERIIQRELFLRNQKPTEEEKKHANIR